MVPDKFDIAYSMLKLNLALNEEVDEKIINTAYNKQYKWFKAFGGEIFAEELPKIVKAKDVLLEFITFANEYVKSGFKGTFYTFYEGNRRARLQNK